MERFRLHARSRKADDELILLPFHLHGSQARATVDGVEPVDRAHKFLQYVFHRRVFHRFSRLLSLVFSKRRTKKTKPGGKAAQRGFRLSETYYFDTMAAKTDKTAGFRAILAGERFKKKPNQKSALGLEAVFGEGMGFGLLERYCFRFLSSRPPEGNLVQIRQLYELDANLFFLSSLRANVFRLCEVAEIEAQMFSSAQKSNRKTTVEFSTEPAILPNCC